jgi:gamma-glutamyltranspeptidase/glutathione hydrolase
MSTSPPHPPKRRWIVAAAALVVAGLAVSLPAVGGPKPAPAYAVATESPGATREASKVLEAGGNAIDAAVCAALVAGFTNPPSSGIGGGGFALVWSARDKRPTILDFRETAPAALDVAALDRRPVAEDKRGQMVGVPGEVAGLFELHQRFGKLTWKDVASRAANLALRGFLAEPHNVSRLTDSLSGPIKASPGFRSVYLPGGKVPQLGQTLRAPKLAQTLRRIASEGRRGLYEGPVAADIVKTARAAGGGLELTDLQRYAVVERQPLRLSWGGKEILTMPPPSAGGILLAQVLALFTPAELTALRDTPAKRLHLLAEAMRGAFADRLRYTGDPAFVTVDVAKLLSPKRLAARKALMAEDRTHTQPRFGLEEAGTHHLVTADADGNWVSLTTTVNDGFGAKLYAERTGIVLNNELTDFSPSTALVPFGLSDCPNRARPGARPVSSMMPTLVLEAGSPVAALGGSGGMTIAPNVTQVLLEVLTSGTTLDAAVAGPRFTVPAPTTGHTLTLESALAKAYGADLTARGELLLTRDLKNAVQIVTRNARGFAAAADPRKGGGATVNNPSVAQ